MNLRNKVSLLVFSFVTIPLFAQTPATEWNGFQQNYIRSFISNDEQTASLVELLSGIQPETEISDQVVVELHQRYPFNVEKITDYIETIREDGSWPDINYNDQKRSAGLSRNTPTVSWNSPSSTGRKKAIAIGGRSSKLSFTRRLAIGSGKNRYARTGGTIRSAFLKHWGLLSC